MKIIITIITLSLSLFGFSQDTRIIYERIPNVEYQLRNEKREHVREQVKAKLLAKKRFFSLIQSAKLSKFEEVDKETKKPFSPMGSTFSLAKIVSCIKDLKNEELYLDVILADIPRTVKDSLLLFETKILPNETKTILGYECYKVEAKNRRDTFTFWVTDDVGISNGPFEYQYKKGCILEVEAKAFSFIAREVDKDYKTKTILNTPVAEKTITYKDYKDKVDEALKSIIINDMNKN